MYCSQCFANKTLINTFHLLCSQIVLLVFERVRNVVGALLSNTMPLKQASMVCLPSRLSHPLVAKLRMPPTVLSGFKQLSAHGNRRDFYSRLERVVDWRFA